MAFLEKLGFGKKKEATEKIASPFAGTVISIEEVKDEVFSSKTLGDGFAVIPKENKLYSPVDGTVEMVFDTKHAIAMKSTIGTELLIHIGLDTVELNGQHFNIQIEPGAIVKKGEILGEIDFEKIKEAGYEMVTPVLVTNVDDYKELAVEISGQTDAGKDVLLVVKK